jgi:hypothetical protein
MTVAAGTGVRRYDGNDVAIDFAFSEIFYNNSDLVLYHQDTAGVITNPTLDVDYTVTGVGTPTSGSVEFPIGGSSYSTLATGEKLTISRESTQARTTDMDDAFYFDDLNLGEDKTMTMVQENALGVDRSIRRNIVDPDNINMELDPADERALKLLGFDENGKPITVINITNTITSGAGAPTTTPNSKGDYYFDDTNDVAYLAFGTASSDDWKALSIDGTFGFVIDGAESAIVAGVKNYNAELTRAGIIYRITTISMVNGVETAKSIKADILMNGVSISASDPLFLDAATEENKTSFTGWTLPFNKHDKPQIEVLSSPVPDAEYITVTVHYKTSSDI